ncbi:MAG: Gfo/Idh/MocA family oxidoreductase [Lentisphaeria bacterium]|jgi:predicted dehydrogenase|nr:Gfo/Idh/MocA family oxidoreductase [Lentisphaeria bacterium]
MAKQSPIRFGAIGPGGAGTCRIRELAAHPLGVQVVAAVDPKPERLDNLQKCIGYDFARYTGQQDYRRMIDECELDAVGIFTPHSLHLEHVEYAIAKGLHVLIEKPMVYGAANAMRVCRAMAASGKVGMVHYQRHYEPQYIKARELIQKGAIGEVKTFFVYMAQDWPGRDWRGEPEFSCGGQVNDSGSHYQDILLWMTGLLPKSAEGHVDCFQKGDRKKVEINGSFNVQLSNGAGGRVLILGDIPSGFVDDVRIVGTKGELMMSTVHGRRLLHRNEKGEMIDIPLAMPKAWPTSPCDNFVKLIRKKTKVNRVPFIFGVRVATLTDSMLRSARSGGKKIECADLLAEVGATMADIA